MRTFPIFSLMAPMLVIYCFMAPPAAQGSALKPAGLRACHSAILADTPKVRAQARLRAGRVLTHLWTAVRSGNLRAQIEAIAWLGGIGDYAKGASEDLVTLLAG
jgi:hypothetical protein